MKSCSNSLCRINIRKTFRACVATVGLVGVTALIAPIGRAQLIRLPSVYLEDGSGNLVLAVGATIDQEGGVHWDSTIIGYLDPDDDTVVDDTAGDDIGTVVY